MRQSRPVHNSSLTVKRASDSPLKQLAKRTRTSIRVVRHQPHTTLQPQQRRISSCSRSNRGQAGMVAGSTISANDPKAFELLRFMGFWPRGIVDVGANRGHWTRGVQAIWPNASFLMIEANEKHRPAWRDLLRNGSKVHAVSTILDSTKRDVQWHTNRGSAGDSLFKEATPAYRGLAPETRHAQTLDGVLERLASAGTVLLPDLVKLDVQGAELAVMRGAARAVAAAEVIVMELPFAGAYNTGAPAFSEYIAALDSAGFVPFDMLEQHHLSLGSRNAIILQVDVVFVRKGSRFLAHVQDAIAHMRGRRAITAVHSRREQADSASADQVTPRGSHIPA